LSILTKTCIVVLVIVVLLACPVFVMKATVDPVYRDWYEQATLKSALAEQDAAHAKVALVLADKEREAAVTQAATADARRVREVSALTAAKAQVENDLAARRTEVAQLTARLEAALSLSTSAVARASALDTQAAKDRARISQLVQAKAKLDSDLRTTQGKFDRTSKLLAVTQEQKADLERRLQEVLSQGVRLADDAGGAAPADISAAISAVLKTGTASIDIGSARGIRRGMKLVIHRADKLLGYLQVIEVAPDNSAGIVVGKRGEVKVGDRVSSEARFTTIGG